MTEAKFTKGPWRVEEGTTLIWGKCDPDDTTTRGMGYPIADCRTTPSSQSSWCTGPSGNEGEANAYLIAAAPELYEALSDMLSSLKIVGYDGLQSEFYVASKTLAKARGETNG